MADSNAVRPPLTIGSGATDSNALDCVSIYGIGIGAPGTLPETITVQVSFDKGVTWKNLRSGGAAVGIGADEGIVITVAAFSRLRLHSSAPTGGARAFQVNTQSRI